MEVRNCKSADDIINTLCGLHFIYRDIFQIAEMFLGNEPERLKSDDLFYSFSISAEELKKYCGDVISYIDTVNFYKVNPPVVFEVEEKTYSFNFCNIVFTFERNDKVNDLSVINDIVSNIDVRLFKPVYKEVVERKE